jgi:DNA-3-methyladenine glycosylase I
MRSYHDVEWGQPVGDDRRLFEKLSLEGCQAGLSWLTILRKRENFRRAFSSFDIDAVARFDQRSVANLMADSGIVRNRAKIEATVNNARRCIDLVDEVGSLASFVWRFEPDAANRPMQVSRQMVQSTSPEATAMSKDLKRRGWAFVGPTTVYAFMQAMGLVNDHMSGCFAREKVEQARRDFRRPG